VVGVKSGAGELIEPPQAPADDDIDDIDDIARPGALPETAAERPASAAAMPVQALPELSEETAAGILPKIAADGTRPLDAYARPVPAIVGAAPKIAIVVGGLGLSQSGTQEALRVLPPEITLAFAPYGNGLDLWQRRARQDGHELLLQIPMEPYDFPDNDPGPHTLLTSNGREKNLERLNWLMARLTTYVGVMNYMGARYTTDVEALRVFLDELTRRGLLYFDDASSSRSRTGTVAGTTGTPFARADLIVDADPDDASIGTRLAQLEQIARTRGIAVGYASALPVSLKRIGEWSKNLENRGITLVPISAALK
jgi:Uncharacterized protein conserved in bacteria